MEGKVIRRGALAGVIAGVLGFIFAWIFAEPWIDKAIDYESGRDAAIKAVNKAVGLASEPDGPEIFSRSIQSTIGIATGIIVFSAAMGAIVAVAYLVLHGRFTIRARTLALVVSGLGFVGVYLAPFVKYPANPPAIGHDFTVVRRGQLYLTMVVLSLIFVVASAFLARKLLPRFGTFHATLLAAGAFIVALSIAMAILPPLGHLAANKEHAHTIGYGSSFSETPLPVRNSEGQIVYPGFPADVLWKFRFYSIIAQLLIWSTIGLVFSNLVERVVGTTSVSGRTNEPVAV